jgi:hypothetical protein
MKGGVGGFGAADLVLRTGDLFPALGDLKNGLLELRFELGDFKNGEGLALFDDVADVNIDSLHVAADFGVDVYGLIRLKLASEGENAAHVAAPRGGDACSGDCGGLGGWIVAVAAACGDGERGNAQNGTGGEQAGG